MHPYRLVLLALASLFSAPLVQSLQLQWEFSGVVSFNPDARFGVNEGDTFIGEINYDSTLPGIYVISASYSSGYSFSADALGEAIDPENIPAFFLGTLSRTLSSDLWYELNWNQWDGNPQTIPELVQQGYFLGDYVYMHGFLDGPPALRVPDAVSTGLCLFGVLLLAAVVRRRKEL
jgi:hypothetical protein